MIRDFSYIFLKHDRIGFVGKNGCGKTTLVKMIAGRIEPDAGSIKVGQTIRIGYYTQEIENEESAGIAYMDADEKVIDYIKTRQNLCAPVMGWSRHLPCWSAFCFRLRNSIVPLVNYPVVKKEG